MVNFREVDPEDTVESQKGRLLEAARQSGFYVEDVEFNALRYRGLGQAIWPENLNETMAWDYTTTTNIFHVSEVRDLPPALQSQAQEISDSLGREDYDGVASSAMALVNSSIIKNFDDDYNPMRPSEDRRWGSFESAETILNDFNDLQSLSESYERGEGDCDDYAIAHYELLRAAGVPPEQLRIMVGDIYNAETNDYQGAHAVLVWMRPDGRNVVFDNIIGEPAMLNDDYTYSAPTPQNDPLTIRFVPHVRFNERVYEVNAAEYPEPQSAEASEPQSAETPEPQRSYPQAAPRTPGS